MVLSVNGIVLTVLLCFVLCLTKSEISESRRKVCPPVDKQYFSPCEDECVDDRNCTHSAVCCDGSCINEDATLAKNEENIYYKRCIVRDMCREGVCKHAVSCTRMMGMNYLCICKPGYSGTNCSTKILYCKNDSCLHGGVCKELETDYRCCCPVGFTGKSCEFELQCMDTKFYKNSCSKKTCSNFKKVECVAEFRLVVRNDDGTTTDVTDQCEP